MNSIESQIAFFKILPNNRIQKKYKNEYQQLFQDKIFKKLLNVNSNLIINLFEIDKINKTLTFEYFKSITLREQLKKDKNISFKQLKKILKDIALAIDNLHQNNIAHIDVNDTNILIDSQLNIKLNDFDFIEILNNKNDDLKKIDIHSYIILIYRIIQLPTQWKAIKDLKFKFNTNNLNYSTCIDFFNTLELH